MSEMTWQPIETAPKDGGMLLLSPDGHIGIGYRRRDSFDGHEWIGEHAAWVGDKYNEKISLWTGGYNPSEATHWMPFPKPPALQTHKEER